MATAIESYAAIGFAFGLWFILRGAARLDPAAGTGTPGFRLAILPGALLMWPYLAYRLVRGGEAPPTEVTAHRPRAGATR